MLEATFIMGQAVEGTEPANVSSAPSIAAESPTVPKTRTGRGLVEPSMRDPRRLYTREQVGEGLAEQNGSCLQCEQPLSLGDAKGHHVDRHADGGRTEPENLAVLCEDCHVDIHSTTSRDSASASNGRGN
jgi:5-methylcytosine-specific restriction endonuclease McrA